MPKETFNNKILILDPNHPVLEERLSDAGFQCDYFPELSLEHCEKMITNYSGIIVRSRFHLNRALLSKAQHLSFIGRVGAGMEGIDVAYAEAHGIRCFNAPEGNRNAVGEHALGMLLALMNKLLIVDKEVRKGIWIREENRGYELEGKTVGIIGYGNTGGAFAKKLSGFDCKVLAYDKYRKDFSDDHVTAVDMDEIFDQADILSLHVPLTDETKYLINASYLNKFRKEIWLINTSRGRVVKTDALVDALNTGKVRGAALDVIEYESLSFESLDDKNMPAPFRAIAVSDMVVLSPHIAGWTHESKLKLANVIADKILAEFKPQ